MLSAQSWFYETPLIEAYVGEVQISTFLCNVVRKMFILNILIARLLINGWSRFGFLLMVIC